MQQQHSLVFVGVRFKLLSVTRGVCLELWLAGARTHALLQYTLKICCIYCLIRIAHLLNNVKQSTTNKKIVSQCDHMSIVCKYTELLYNQLATMNQYIDIFIIVLG